MKLVIKKTGYLEITHQGAAVITEQLNRLGDMAHLQSLASSRDFEELNELDTMLKRISEPNQPKSARTDVK